MNSKKQLTYKEIFKACESFETDLIALDKNCNRIRAIERLNSFRETKTLVKLIDEYNYMMYTRKLNAWTA